MIQRLATLLCVISCLLCSAQPAENNPKGAILVPSLVSFGIAYARPMESLHFGITGRNEVDKYVHRFTRPCFTFDYRLASRRKKWYAMGFAASYQQIGVKLNPATHYPPVYDEVAERINIAIKPTFLHSSKKFEVFWGPRIGITFWRHLTEDPEGGKPNTEIMPAAHFNLGFRYFFGRLGLGIDVGIGSAPYIVQGSLAFRLN